MKTLNLLIAMVTVAFFSTTTKGQNLVPNPSFEDTVACPAGIGQIDKAVGWNSFRQTPDYFNSCNSDTIGTSYCGSPNNYFGYQVPHTGNAYGGLYTYVGGALNGRECIGIKLMSSLIERKRYNVSFFTNKSSIYRPGGPLTKSASNKIGVKFSTVEYSYTNPIPIDNKAHIYSDSIISDTLNWINVSGSFVADSNYSYMVIGNFFSDSNTSVISFDSVPGKYSSAYYYIDDVYVTLDTEDVINEFYLEKSTYIYPNPSSGLFQLSNVTQEPLGVVVYSLIGKVVKSFSSSERQITIDLTSYSNGIYLVLVRDKSNSRKMKVVKI